MKLILQEMKKIWNPVIIGILIAFGLIYYMLFADFYITYFINGSDAQADFDVASEWSVKYGNTLEENELEEIQMQLEAEKDIFTDQVQNLPIAQENDILSYDRFIEFETDYYDNVEQTADMEKERIIWTIIESTNIFRIQSIESHIEYFQRIQSNSLQDLLVDGETTEAERKRIEALDGSQIKYGYLPVGILDSTTGLTISFSIWVMLSVLILLSPTVVRDRLHRVQNTQWSSVTGRSILTYQIRAAVISAVMLTAINCLIYGGLLVSRHALVFQDFYLMTIEYTPWFNWTYGEYLMVIVVMDFAIGTTVALLTVLLSRCSSNYIGMLLKAIPLFAILILIFSMFPIVTRPFFLWNPMSVRIPVKGIEMLLLTGLLLLSVLLNLFVLWRQRGKDLLT